MPRPVGKDTEVVKGVKKSISYMVDFLYTARTTLDVVAGSDLPPVFMKGRLYRNGLLDAKERGVRIRIVTEVTRDDMALNPQRPAPRATHVRHSGDHEDRERPGQTEQRNA